MVGLQLQKYFEDHASKVWEQTQALIVQHKNEAQDEVLCAQEAAAECERQAKLAIDQRTEALRIADAKFVEVAAQADQYVRSAHGTVEGSKSALKTAEERHAEHVDSITREAREMIAQQVENGARMQEVFVKQADEQAERLKSMEQKLSVAESGKETFIGQMVQQYQAFACA